MKPLVVLPTYNEARSIDLLVSTLLATDPRLDVLVVDDSSPDGTGSRVRERTAREPRLNLIERPARAGIGSAYRAGFEWGRERGYDVLVEMDADLSHPVDRLPALLATLAGSGDGGAGDGADLVIGSRYVAGGSTVNWSWLQRLVSRSANAYAGAVLGLQVRDPTAGFRAFRMPLLERIGVAGLTSDHYSFQVQTAYLSVLAGARVVEVPIEFMAGYRSGLTIPVGAAVEALARVTGWALRDLVTEGGRSGRRCPARPGGRLVARLGAWLWGRLGARGLAGGR
jgi:dolichol-phosphate mannosyltransferase